MYPATLGLLLAALLAFPVSAEPKAPESGLPRSSAERTMYVCTARSLTGRRFSATGENQTLTQEAALRLCESHALRCIAAGCVQAR